MNPPEWKKSWKFLDLVTDYSLAEAQRRKMIMSSFRIADGEAHVIGYYNNGMHAYADFPVSLISGVGTNETTATIGSGVVGGAIAGTTGAVVGGLAGGGCGVVVTLSDAHSFAFKVGRKTNSNRQKAARISGKIKQAISETMGNVVPASADSTDTKTCPYCAETIKAAAIKCRYCGSDLTDNPQVPPPPPIS